MVVSGLDCTNEQMADGYSEDGTTAVYWHIDN